jgi:hypothetical protein
MQWLSKVTQTCHLYKSSDVFFRNSLLDGSLRSGKEVLGKSRVCEKALLLTLLTVPLANSGIDCDKCRRFTAGEHGNFRKECQGRSALMFIRRVL